MNKTVQEFLRETYNVNELPSHNCDIWVKPDGKETGYCIICGIGLHFGYLSYRLLFFIPTPWKLPFKGWVKDKLPNIEKARD